MLCPTCGTAKSRVCNSRTPRSRPFHIPVQIREEIAENIGFLDPTGWVVRFRSCQSCNHQWWTIEASIDTMNKAVNNVP